MDTCHVSKTIQCTPSRVNPNINYELWVIMMYQSIIDLSIIKNAALW